MCYGCYEEYGEPKIVNPKTIEAAKLTDDVYEFASAGGLCHIVIDDFNINDNSIEYCIGAIIKKEHDFTDEQYQVQRSCMDAYLALSIDERASALAIHQGWISV